jgi:HAMP domain-containing protein
LKPQNRTAVVLFIAFSVVLSMFLAGSLGAQTSSDSKSTEKFSASSIQIEPPDPGDVPMPPEFRMAIYENLITQIEKTKKFQHVYRSGDKDAASATDLVTLHTTARAFNKGSQRKREVTTVTGSTSMTLNVRITDHAGKTLIDQDVKGKVRFMGENLRATFDFSKKVAAIIRDRF